MSRLTRYLEKNSESKSAAAIAYYASLDHVETVSPQTAKSIEKELSDQRSYLKLIASENYSSLATQLAMGNLLTDKYAEGIAGRRFYAGCENVDNLELLAATEIKKLFGSNHAYVQPHSGADANLIAFAAILNKEVECKELKILEKKSLPQLSEKEFFNVRKVTMQQKMLGMSLNSGGHLTHGYRINLSAKLFESYSYDVEQETGLLNYSSIHKQAKEIKPLVLLAGFSAYPRKINFAKMREIANDVGAIFMVDMAHFAGLVAGKVFTGDYDPVPFAHIVTSTTHKTLRGPRGGIILSNDDYAPFIDKGCPFAIGGPLPHVIAAKTVAFKEAMKPEFQEYAAQIVKNSQALAENLQCMGCKVLTGGTDNHIVLVDVSPYGITGKQAEVALRKAGITVNRNAIPFDKNGPWLTSGIRVGTPALTTLGMKEEEMKLIATLMHSVIKAVKPSHDQKKNAPSRSEFTLTNQLVEKIKKQVEELLTAFPLYPELSLDRELNHLNKFS